MLIKPGYIGWSSLYATLSGAAALITAAGGFILNLTALDIIMLPGLILGSAVEAGRWLYKAYTLQEILDDMKLDDGSDVTQAGLAASDNNLEQISLLKKGIRYYTGQFLLYCAVFVGLIVVGALALAGLLVAPAIIPELIIGLYALKSVLHLSVGLGTFLYALCFQRKPDQENARAESMKQAKQNISQAFFSLGVAVIVGIAAALIKIPVVAPIAYPCLIAVVGVGSVYGLCCNKNVLHPENGSLTGLGPMEAVKAFTLNVNEGYNVRKYRYLQFCDAMSHRIDNCLIMMGLKKKKDEDVVDDESATQSDSSRNNSSSITESGSTFGYNRFNSISTSVRSSVDNGNNSNSLPDVAPLTICLSTTTSQGRDDRIALLADEIVTSVHSSVDNGNNSNSLSAVSSVPTSYFLRTVSQEKKDRITLLSGDKDRITLLLDDDVDDDDVDDVASEYSV